MNALALLLWTMPQTPVQEPAAVAVPRGRTIDLDGKLGVEEWQAAARHALGTGGELLLQHDERFLYLGLRGNVAGWAHVAYVGDPAKPLLWPAPLDDACTQRPLLIGTTPGDLVFRPERWERMKLLPPAADGAGATR